MTKENEVLMFSPPLYVELHMTVSELNLAYSLNFVDKFAFLLLCFVSAILGRNHMCDPRLHSFQQLNWYRMTQDELRKARGKSRSDSTA